MNIYFTTSITQKNQNKAWYEQIIALLEADGHKLNKENLRAKPEQLQQYSEKQVMQIYKTIIQWIDHCDVLIAEISKSSSGVGFEISYALNQKKPVLAIYNEEIAKSPVSIPIRGNTSRYLTFVKCNNKNLQKTLKNFLSKAKKKLDTKFILIISPEIDKYLEWAGDQRRSHKAQIVRSSLEKEIKNDKEYQTFLRQK